MLSPVESRPVLLATLLVASAMAAPAGAMPANDRFADALLLEGAAGQITDSNRGATPEVGEKGLIDVSGGASVWYRWTAPRAGLLIVYTLGSTFDTLLAAYAGDALESAEVLDENDDTDVGFFQSRIAIPVQQGTEYRLAVDGFGGASGNITLTWFLDYFTAPPDNDLFADRIALDGESGQAFGTNQRADREADEPDHFGQGFGGSVWWTWTAVADGDVTFDNRTSNFASVVAVYSGDTLEGLTGIAQAAGDGTGELAEVRFRVARGVEYHIAVDGLDGDTGIIVLNWLFSTACDPPPAPRSPEPADAATGVARTVTLRWNAEPRQVLARLIHGDDDRRDAHEVTDPATLAALDSIAVIVPRAILADNGDGTYSLPAGTLGESASFCESEPFFDQPNPGVGTGFLAGPDRIITAAGVVRDAVDCGGLAFVFGFRTSGDGSPVLTFDASQVYFCSRVLASRSDPAGGDWTMVELDREVPDRRPLRVRRRDRIEDGRELVVIGHSLGLPVKVAGGAQVRDNTAGAFFTANLDTSLRGGLGSPVLDAETLRVEGIFVRGDEDIVMQGNCFTSRRCADDGCAGQEVTRATAFQHLVTPDLDDVVYEVHFGPCGNLSLLGETTATEFALPMRLEPDTTYCWRIAARNECGRTLGPFWAFRTTASVDPVFRRADVNQDGEVNLSDGIGILVFLFRGGEPLGCMKSGDSDDDSQVTLTDAVFTLNHLFLGGPEPPPPFAECGVDPTPKDGLSCESFAPCGG